MSFIRAAFRAWPRILDVLAIAVVLLVVYRVVVAPRNLSSPERRAPAIRLASLDAHAVPAMPRPGRVTFVDFWASWCTPCQASLPLVERFAAAHPDVDVVPIDVGESPAVAAEYARAHGVRHVLFDSSQRVSSAYGVVGFPTMVVVDRRGFVRATWTGFNPAIEAAMANARERLVAAGADTNDVAEAATPAKPLTISIEEDPSSLDTALDTPYGWLLAPLTQGYLFLVDDRGGLVPDLAVTVPTRANGGISKDGRTISYRIRTGTWSDGARFDARDLAATVSALRNDATNVPDRSTVDQIARVEVPRPDRFVVHLRAPSAPFLSAFLTLGASDPFAILPAHVIRTVPNLNRSPLDTQPVGLGPFRLSSWHRGEELAFEANPHYWRGRTGVDRIRVKIVPNATTRLLSVRTGDLDLGYISGLQVDEAQRTGVTVTRGTTNIVDYLAFNFQKEALRDAHVREAIAAAIDRTKLASAIYRGLEIPTDTGQLDPAIAGTTHIVAYDPNRARALLAGRKLELEFAIAGTWRSSSAAALAIADDLHRVGIEATIRSYSQGVFWGPKAQGGIIDGGRFDIALTSWSPSLDPDRSYLFGCSARPPNGGNAGDWCDPRFDRLETTAMETYDESARVVAYREAHAILARDLGVLPIGLERSAYAISPRFEGFRPNVLGRDFWNAWEWRVGPSTTR
jgi:peptide/nickel transport system substrate-binding protein